MPAPDTVRELARHAEWADSTLWTAVLAAPVASSDARIFEWLHHVHTVQQAFLAIWRGRPVEPEELAAFPEAGGLATWGREGHRQVREHLAGVDEAELERELEIPWAAHVEARFARPAGPVTLGESVVQVAMHSAHHRGQVAARLRSLEVEPPLIDYIAWLWRERSEAEWTAAAGA